MANRCWLNRIRGIVLPASFVHLLLTITSGRYFFAIAIRCNLLHPSVAHTVSFFHMTTTFLAPLSGVVAPVSCSRSCPLTSAGFRSCGVPPGSILRSSGLATFSICFPAHVSHIALVPEVALASVPFPICSKIWEVCFDVNTALDDPPINSGGATRSRHCSLLGGATRMRHDEAISGKRLTVPSDSDFQFVSLICDGLASQHAFLLFFPQCSTQFPWSDLLLAEVCSDMHAAFSGLPGVCTARFPSVSMIPLLESLFQPLPWMPARSAASVFHRCLVVSPSPS